MFGAHSYFQFLIASTNHHGIHSPFVYDLVTKGLYPKTISKSNRETLKKFANGSKTSVKSLELLVKTISFLNFQKVDCTNLANYQSFFTILQNDFLLKIDNSLIHNELLYLDIQDSASFSRVFETISSDPLTRNISIFFYNIHKDKRSFETWQKLTEIPEINVSIDFFHAGLLFVRPQQVKEHFVVRY